MATFGILIVGLGGNNGVTTVAGIRANQLGLEWEGLTGKVKANYLGCITQLPSKGGKGGYREKYSLADANHAAIGGYLPFLKHLGQDSALVHHTCFVPAWMVVGSEDHLHPHDGGDALYDSHVLDYDLVSKVRDYMNSEVSILKGVWSPSFIGESQHATATHVVPPMTHSQSLEHLQEDIRKFKADHKITGHVTVIWSASVERPCMKDFDTADQLLKAIADNDPEVSPSILYATAAALEGCSFVNGGSQNTLCGALLELAHKTDSYVLGTDFKAGQTKFKTAAVEYIRALGLRPTVIASSNHLGNNDMLNLTSKKTLDAKMRVKSDIFAGWEELIDHQVRVMYTPYIGDEKRDIVEYTSLGFLNCAHTMVTYTRCMDSILCVPLMIDVAVWCDYFHRVKAKPTQAALATAYLFKVPEGAAKGVDPGFFHQMSLLDKVLAEATAAAPPISPSKGPATTTGGGGGMVRIPLHRIGGPGTSPMLPLRDRTEPAGPLIGGVICAGLSCLDLQLVGASGEGTFESIKTFQQQVFCPGGAAAQSSLALGHLGVPAVSVCTKIGKDLHGDELVRQLREAGVDTSMVIRDSQQTTSLAVLPILQTGARGCFVNLQANESFTPQEVEAVLSRQSSLYARVYRAVHVGYPHLMKHFQGMELKSLFTSIKYLLNSPIISLDLNGVQPSSSPDILADALPHTDVLHLNHEEAEIITGHAIDLKNPVPSLRKAAGVLFDQGVALVAITLGEQGAYVAVTSQEGRIQTESALAWQASKWEPGSDTLQPAYPLEPGSVVNANGAGDAFVAGLLVALLTSAPLSLEQATKVGLLTALQRVDSKLRASARKATFTELVELARKW